ncbi:MAG: GMC family oxidoreductase N-terminal domain-containing protein [Methyloligellaceae bacterium]
MSAQVEHLSRPIADIKAHYDVVVVGSGYGGGVSASRLARWGRRVWVLERGKEFQAGDFPDRFPEVRRELQLTGRKLRRGPRTGLFDVRLGQDIHVFVGCGLGGGSLINAGVALRPDGRVFEDPAWPVEIMSDGLLDEGFARARRWLRPATDPLAEGHTKFKALQSASAPFTEDPRAAEVVVSFEETVNPANMPQPACTLCGDCCLGCNVGAKNTVSMTYLPDARRRGADIFTEAQVERLQKAPDGRWRVLYRATDDRRDGPGDVDRDVTADIVILAAGTLGSTEILLRSRDAGLALSERLGSHFSANGDLIAFGYGTTAPVNAIGVGHPPKVEIDTVGACVSGQVEMRDAERLDHGLYLQEGVMPSGLAPLLPVAFLPDGRILGAAQSLIKGVYKGPFSRFHTFFVVSHDSAAGRLALADDQVTVVWPGVADEPVYERVDRVLEAAVAANGGRYIKNPLTGTVMGAKPATAHPLGGCGMGPDRTAGVVNHKGQVFDGTAGVGSTDVHEGLFVCDGSVIPRSLGANPLLTITALSERAMIHLARDRGWTFDETPGRRTQARNAVYDEIRAS